MKRVLYITSIEVPYRVRFFNELAKMCNLTVLYERRKSSNRETNWTSTEKIKCDIDYLDGINVKDEYGFSLRIISVIRKHWDAIIVGCYNSPVQIVAMFYMNYHNIPYIVNLDGEPFIGKGMKALIKKMILNGACGYLTAGLSAGESLKAAIGDSKPITPYYFSSLKDEEIAKNSCSDMKRENFVLVVGQYFDYKGMDVAFRSACMDKSIRYKFVGMGKRTELFLQEMGDMPDNIEVIPFLQKKELEEEYRKCAMLVLPTRQECWGLVVNEAASFGTPIVSTWGSGAAVEFLGGAYSQYLAKPGDSEALLECIHLCINDANLNYSEYLKDKSKDYSIDRSVSAHLRAIDFLSRI